MDELMKAWAVKCLPREARHQHQVKWWESAIEGAVRPLLGGESDLVVADLLPMPPPILFRTSAARTHLYDHYVTSPNGFGKLGHGEGKRGKSCAVQLHGEPRMWPAYIERKTDEDKKAVLLAASERDWRF